MNKKIALAVALVVLFSLPAVAQFSLTSEHFDLMMNVPPQPGVAHAEGTVFEITDSEYLNIEITSTEIVKMRVESIPETISMFIFEPKPTSYSLTIDGLKPSTTYYLYRDSYKNLEEFTTNSKGEHTFSLDSSNMYVWIQPQPGTLFIFGSGDDCPGIRSGNKCTFNQNVEESIEVQASNQIIDCAGHTIEGTGSGNGIFVVGRNGITIKNCIIKRFSTGISFIAANNNNIVSNKITKNFVRSWIV